MSERKGPPPMQLQGVGPDAPMVEGEHGGKQSATPYAFHLVPPIGLARVAHVVYKGEKNHGAWNWLKIPAEDHVGRVIQHCYAFLMGDSQEGDPIVHLEHAACRALMAVEKVYRDRAEAQESELPRSGFEQCASRMGGDGIRCEKRAGHSGIHTWKDLGWEKEDG